MLKTIDLAAIRAKIRETEMEDEGGRAMFGKTVTASICPNFLDCDFVAWSFEGKPCLCSACMPDHMIVDTFVL